MFQKSINKIHSHQNTDYIWRQGFPGDGLTAKNNPKMKSRLSSLDICAIAKELSLQLANVRLQNIYDYNDQRSFVFKFAKPGFKLYLLVESGIRLHATEACQQEDSRAVPSGFVVKLRKHLRNRRLSSIKQVGFDRIVELTFPGLNEEDTVYLYLEFYSLGNVILTDHTKKIISLLRTVKLDQFSMRVGDVYCNEKILQLPLPSQKDLYESLSNMPANEALKRQLGPLPAYVIPFILSSCDKSIQGIASKTVEVMEAIKGEACCHFSPALVLKNEKFVDFVCLSNDSDSADLRRVQSVNRAADLFFGQRESVELESKEAKMKREADLKLKAIESEQLGRICSIEKSIEQMLLDAQAIESNVQKVESACLVIRTCLDNEMSWNEIQELLEEEKRIGRSTATIIDKLGLATDNITLLLDVDGCERKVVVNIFLSAFANSSRLYDQRKNLIQKLERTKAAYKEAIKSAYEKIKRALAEHKSSVNRAKLQKSRKTLWFERFAWFITSDLYLVLGGRDAQQNEQVVKKYLRPQDVYVHAEISGAASVVVRNHLDCPITQQSLSEAGTFAVCMSRAWESKLSLGAWWVNADQVSKTAPSGEYLGTGSFMIRGQKNFLPPAQLQLGFGFMMLTDNVEVLAKRKEKRLEREDMRRIAHKEGTILQDEQDIIASVKRYEDAIDTTKLSELSIVDASHSAPKRQFKDNYEGKEANKAPPPPSLQKSKKNPQHQQQQPRGKKGKLKKIKEKYADQDEEERAEKMKLLASCKPKPVQPTKQTMPRKKTTPQDTKAISINADAEEESEDIVAMDEVSFFDSLLTSVPEHHSNTLQVVPVCGPWNVIRNYALRVKLTPGGQKKGRLVRSMVNVLLQSTSDNNIKQAIKGVPDTDLIQCLFVKSASLSLTTTEASILKKQKNKKKN